MLNAERRRADGTQVRGALAAPRLEAQMPRTVPHPSTTAPAAPAAAPAVPAQRTRRARAAAPAPPLGSLTQRRHQVDGACPVCGGTQLMRLSMTLTDGTPVLFTSCRRCEHRRWEAAGDELSISTVLEHSRKH